MGLAAQLDEGIAHTFVFSTHVAFLQPGSPEIDTFVQ
jgi:hypothetical protein